MPVIECRYCHRDIPVREYPAHVAKHRQLKEDGQHETYATLKPDERFQTSLDGVPQVYCHMRCQVCTRMPEDIIRSYLVDPFLYNADETFCCGCGIHVPLKECYWIETKEDLQKYMDRVRASKRPPPPKKPLLQRALGWILGTSNP
jgi:hypothetical protein